ncbi:MAG: LamG domain-containing protein [Candidatus Aenigmatarchaeota archaeon]
MKVKGISPFISMVLIVVISFSALTLTLTTILPTIEKTRASLTVDDALKNLDLIDTMIKEVASEAKGSRRSITINVPTDASYIFDSTRNLLIFEYNPKQPLDISGKIGAKFIEKSLVFSDYFNNYTEGENASSVWNIIRGNWSVKNSEYRGINGTAWRRIGNLNNFEISASVRNISSIVGEVFPLTVDPRSLVGFWTFDEGSGTIAYDYSGNENNGTLYNGSVICSGGDCPNWVDGKFGKALRFDGSNDNVLIPFSPSLNVTQSNRLTISSWIKRSVTGVEHQITARDALDFWIGSDNKLKAHITGVLRSSTGTITDTNWHHVAVTYDGSNVKFYIDGALDSTIADAAGLEVMTNNNIYIGWNGTSMSFNGTIDEVKIFNKSLTTDEIKVEYQLGLKKLISTGTTTKITDTTDLYLVLSSPSGESGFDNIRVRTGENNLKLIIPYDNIKFQNTFRVGPGNQNIVIEHNGTSGDRVLIAISS